MRLEKLIEKNVAADRDLKERQRTLIKTENWLPNSPGLNPVYYSVWGVATDKGKGKGSGFI